MPPLRRDFRQRHQHETSALHPRMRQLRRTRFDAPMVVENVEIKCAGRIPDIAHAAEEALGLLQSFEQGGRRKLCLHLRNGIHEPGIAWHWPSFALVELRNFHRFDSFSPQRSQCSAKCLRRGARGRWNIGSERDQYHAMLLSTPFQPLAFTGEYPRTPAAVGAILPKGHSCSASHYGGTSMLFYPQEKLAIFIDGANLYGAAKGLGFDIDYKRLLELFARKGVLMRAFYYTAVAEDQEFSPLRPLVDWLDYNGFAGVRSEEHTS